MATITSSNATTLHTANNVREDLGNIIFNVTPFKTNFFSAIAKTKATNNNHEWLTDTLSVGANNKSIEAELVSTTAGDTRTRKSNYLQISTKTVTVTDKAEFMDKAGVPGSEMAYQVMKLGKELQMDVEFDILSINAKVAPTASTSGESASVASWILANQNTQGSANGASTGSTVPTPGTNRTLTEPMITGLIDGVWTNSGDLDNHSIYGDATMVGSLRSLSGIADSTDAVAGDGTIWNRVTVYQSQFGPVKVVANKQMPSNTAYILDPSTWAVAFAGGMAIRTKDLPVAASAKQKLLEMYYTLEARSEEANAGLYAIT